MWRGEDKAVEVWTFPVVQLFLIWKLCRRAERTLSLRTLDWWNRELPETSDLLTAHTTAASRPRGILAKQPTRTPGLLSNDQTVILVSSSHAPDETSRIPRSVCGVKELQLWAVLPQSLPAAGADHRSDTSATSCTVYCRRCYRTARPLRLINMGWCCVITNGCHGPLIHQSENLMKKISVIFLLCVNTSVVLKSKNLEQVTVCLMCEVMLKGHKCLFFWTWTLT